MKKIRLFICFVILLALSSVSAFAATNGVNLGFVATIAQEEATGYEFKIWTANSEDTVYLTLPASVKDSTVVVKGSATLDGTLLKNGEEITAPAQGIHSLVYNGREYTLEVLYGSEIPTICITTDTGNLNKVYASKENKEGGIITIFDGEEVAYNGGLDYIKGRGNATWHYDKKPFNIKLDDKTDLYGMGKNKSWSLLANYTDLTGLKNKMVIDLAEKVGIQFNPQSVIADLFVNGEYMGMYTLIEKVEIDETRIDIANLEDLNEEANPDIDVEDSPLGGERGGFAANIMKYVEIPQNPEDITGGYLLEFDMYERYAEEISGFMTAYSAAIVVKSPEYASKEQVEYISNYYQEFEYAVLSDDGNNTLGKHYSDYIDTDSLAKVMVLNEFVKNLDSGMSSFFIYKDAGDKMYAGPMWDFDMSLGVNYNRDGVDMADPVGLWASSMKRYEKNGYTLPALMNQKEEFRLLQAQQWQNVFLPLMEDFVADIDALYEKTKESAVINTIRWADSETLAGSTPQQWYEKQVSALKDFATKRADFMSEAFSESNYYICYRSNGADGEMLDINYYTKGDTATVKESEFFAGKKTLLGWNTKPNGRGANYAPGEEVEMDKTLVLYAQWNEPTTINKIRSMIATFFK